jgi:hypothetical protein
MDKSRKPDGGRRRVEVRRGEGGAGREPELFVDGQPVQYGRLFDGTYYVPERAYEWADDLESLGRKVVEYRDRSRMREQRSPRGGRRVHP